MAIKRIVFMGTPDFAVPALEALLQNSVDVEDTVANDNLNDINDNTLYQVVAVISQPNKPKGRKQIVLDTPVAKVAKANNINLFQPAKINAQASIEYLRELAPDLIITAAYGQILKKPILNLPTYGCINIHASLLPEFRGAAPIHAAIIDGKSESGITIMQMDEGMDSGDILFQRKIPINDHATAGSLFDQLALLGATAIIDFLPLFFAGNYSALKQDPASVSYAPKLTRDFGEIDWSASAVKIEQLIRGTYPWPGAFTYLAGKRLKIFSASVVNSDFSDLKKDDRADFYNQINGTKSDRRVEPFIKFESGSIVANHKTLIVRCGTGLLEILELQFDSGKRMPAAECSHNFRIGEKFGGKRDGELNSVT